MAAKLFLEHSTDPDRAISVGLFVVGDVGLGLLEPEVQLGTELGKVEGLAGNDCAEGGGQVDVGESEMT